MEELSPSPNPVFIDGRETPRKEPGVGRNWHSELHLGRCAPLRLNSGRAGIGRKDKLGLQISPSLLDPMARRPGHSRVMVPLRVSEIPDKGKGLRAMHVLSQVNPESVALTASEGGRMRVHQDKHRPPKSEQGS